MTLTLFYHVLSFFCSASVGISIDKSSMMYEVYAVWCMPYHDDDSDGSDADDDDEDEDQDQDDDDDDDDDHDDESFGLSVGMPVGLLKSQPSSQDQRASVSTRRPWAKRHWILSGSLFLAKPSFFMVKPCTFIDGLNMVKSFFMVSSHPDYHPKEENIIPSLHVKHHHSPKYVYAHKFPVKPFLGRVSSIRGKGSVG